MARPETAVRTFLLTQSSVTDLVGTRIYPMQLPQNAQLPAIVYRRITTGHEETIDGSKGGLADARVQYDCYAVTHDQAHDVAEALRLSGILDLHGVTNSVDFRGVRLSSGLRMEDDSPTDGSAEWRYWASQDYQFFYLEEV